MKLVASALLAGAAALLAGVLAPPARAEVSFEFAYSNLSQHGNWQVSAQYGRVWQPREYHRGWNPYYDGHWVATDMGWTWISDYQWGSLPYHYGTWVEDPRYGWVWIPGQVWAPSWVVFRSSPDYIGWAPVPPGYSVGVSIGFGSPSSFVYVSSRNFLSPTLRTAIIPSNQTNVFVNNTTVINNISVRNNVVINNGPDVQVIERATGRTVRRQQIEQVAGVAPFERVTRDQLAVPPERIQRGVRVADPVPESHPLPASGAHGQPRQQGQPSHKTTAVNPSRQAAPSAPAPSAQTSPQHKGPPQQAPHAQQSQPAQPPRHDATAPSAPAPKDKSAAQQAPAPQSKAKPKSDTKDKKDKKDQTDNPDKKNGNE